MNDVSGEAFFDVAFIIFIVPPLLSLGSKFGHKALHLFVYDVVVFEACENHSHSTAKDTDVGENINGTPQRATATFSIT